MSEIKSRCDYCNGDNEGFIMHIPKMQPCNGNALVCETWEDAYLLISLPYKKKLAYKINYCPMCGRKLAEKKV